MRRNDFDALAEKLRNWGRWGPEDQRGTVNHIGPEALKRGVEAVSSHKLFNLGLNIEKDGPQPNLPGFRTNPLRYVTALGSPLNPAKPHASFSDDVFHMALQCSTQWDALSHVHYDGELYNGCKACDSLSLKDGAIRHGIEHLASPGIMSRGVLLDVARHKGKEILDPVYEITVDDLRATAEAQGVTIATGDIVLVRTGQIRKFTEQKDVMAWALGQPGLIPECAEWLHEVSAAAICADNMAVEVTNEETIFGDMALPFHMLCIRDMGMPLGEIFNLEALAADCAADGRYSFLLSAPPLSITGAFGSPINPLALK